jgi:MFS family permease
VKAEERRTVAVAGYLHGLSHGNVLAIPVFLSLAWSQEFTSDLTILGLLAAMAYACFGLASVPFGYLADRRPARPMLVLCAAGIAASLLAVAASPSLPFLALSLAALGLFSGIYHPTGLSLISRRVRESGRGFGWHGMGGSLGVALGPAVVGGLLAVGWPWRSVAVLLVLAPLVGLALLLAFGVGETPPQTTVPPVSPRSLLRLSVFLILLVYMFSGIAYWGTLTFLPRLIGPSSFVLLLALGAVGQVIAGHLADRGRPSVTLFGLSVFAGSLLVGLALDPREVFLPAAWLFGFLLFSLEPLQNTLVTAEVDVNARGMAFGLTFLSVFGLGSVGAALAGFLLQRNEKALLFAGLGLSLGMSGACALFVGRRSRRTRRE